jgi:uncharacterized protein (DUF2384 family)
MNKQRIAKELVKLARELFEYHEPIKFTDFTVNRNLIHVSSSSTTYVNSKRQEFSDDKISDAMDKLKRVQVLARKSGVKLKGYSQRMSELKSLDSEYSSKVNRYNKLFDELYKNWKKIEKKKDLFYVPTHDLDKRIPEYGVAIKIGWTIDKMFHGGEVLSKVSAIDSRLDKALRDLEYNADNYVDEDYITMLGV